MTLKSSESIMFPGSQSVGTLSCSSHWSETIDNVLYKNNNLRRIIAKVAITVVCVIYLMSWQKKYSSEIDQQSVLSSAYRLPCNDLSLWFSFVLCGGATVLDVCHLM